MPQLQNKNLSFFTGNESSRWFVFSIFFIILIPAASPIFIFSYYKSSHSSKNTALLIGLLFAMLAYGVETTLTADIDRYTSSLSRYRSITLWDAPLFQGGYSSNGAYAYNLLAWIVAHAGNDRLLRSTICLITYGFSSFVILDYGRTSGWKEEKTAAAVLAFVCITPFFNQLSYVKSSPAFAIILCAVYKDLHLGIRNAWTVCLYLLAPLFHNSTLLILGGIILFHLFRFRPIPTCLGIGAVFPVALFSADFFPGSLAQDPLLSFVYSALQKLSLYVNYQDAGWAAASQSSILLMGYRYFFCAIALVSILFHFIGTKTSESEHSQLSGFTSVWAFVILVVSLIVQMDVFFRYAMPFIALFSIQCLANSPKKLSSFLRFFLFGCSAVGLIVQLLYLASVSDMDVFLMTAISGLMSVAFA